MKLNINKFNELTKAFTDSQLSLLIGVSRCQIWRAKNNYNVGSKFIAGFRKAFPKAKTDDYFFYN